MTNPNRENREIRELEALILRCKERGDPESLWIKSLLEEALLTKRKNPRTSLRHPVPEGREFPEFTHN